MQYVAIFAGVGGVQHSIYCQYLQGVERNLIVVNIWSNICFQNRSKSLKIAPKNEKSLKIARSYWLRRRNTGSTFNMCNICRDLKLSTCQYMVNICNGRPSIFNINICSEIVNLFRDGYLQAPPGTRDFVTLPALNVSVARRLQLPAVSFTSIYHRGRRTRPSRPLAVYLAMEHAG